MSFLHWPTLPDQNNRMLWLAIVYMCHPSFLGYIQPSVVLHGGGAFGRILGHEGGALMNGISALIKETPREPLTPSPIWGHSEKMAFYESGSSHQTPVESVPWPWTSSLFSGPKPGNPISLVTPISSTSPHPSRHDSSFPLLPGKCPESCSQPPPPPIFSLCKKWNDLLWTDHRAFYVAQW